MAEADPLEGGEATSHSRKARRCVVKAYLISCYLPWPNARGVGRTATTGGHKPVTPLTYLCVMVILPPPKRKDVGSIPTRGAMRRTRSEQIQCSLVVWSLHLAISRRSEFDSHIAVSLLNLRLKLNTADHHT